MVVSFVSNYINHHQLPFCEAMKRQIGDGGSFYFIQTMPMEEKRRQMGWGVDEKALSYLVLYYEEPERAQDLIEKSDVVLFGWTGGVIDDIERKRLSSGKLAFRVSERIYREGQYRAISPRGLMSKYREHFVYRSKPVYLLCTGAYVASDFALIKSYPGKMLKWGYFPDASKGAEMGTGGDQDVDSPLRFCWAGRLIDLKHPEFAVKAASDLKKSGIQFTMDIVGGGPLLESIRKMAASLNVADSVNITGGKAPYEVLEYMRRADIFLFTSNYLEGWGAVVNEAMQCSCAVVASNEAGSVPFLIEDKVNGLVYENGDYSSFGEKVLFLAGHRELITEYKKKAKETIDRKWNAEVAARELLRFSREFLSGRTPSFAVDGPVSQAQVLKAPGFVRTLQERNHLE
ncbi:MAG: glycosyltransferase family 4 protein [Butyrivibrio sp.]|nr:glycosyltransferase family 4 protein [Butyrivibrio sp.]